MHDYEVYPQEVMIVIATLRSLLTDAHLVRFWGQYFNCIYCSLHASVTSLLMHVARYTMWVSFATLRLFSESDGVILNTSQHIENEAIKAWRRWIEPRPLFVLGPLASAPSDKMVRRNENTSSGTVAAFLDAALEKYGSRSVVYVSDSSTL